MILLEPINVCL